MAEDLALSPSAVRRPPTLLQSQYYDGGHCYARNRASPGAQVLNCSLHVSLDGFLQGFFISGQ
jgi:hypothetical protein